MINPALVRSAHLPVPSPRGDRLEFRAGGRRTASELGMIGRRPNARGYTALWRRRAGLPPADADAALRVTYLVPGRLLAAGSARVQRFPTWREKQSFFRQFG